jgi:hypothetical protein
MEVHANFIASSWAMMTITALPSSTKMSSLFLVSSQSITPSVNKMLVGREFPEM